MSAAACAMRRCTAKDVDYTSETILKAFNALCTGSRKVQQSSGQEKQKADTEGEKKKADTEGKKKKADTEGEKKSKWWKIW